MQQETKTRVLSVTIVIALMLGLFAAGSAIAWGSAKTKEIPVPGPVQMRVMPGPTRTVTVTVPTPGPTVTAHVTHTAKPSPRPTKTVFVTVTRSPEAASRSRTIGGLWPGATSIWASVPALYVNRAICVVHHESWHSGTYTAENPRSTASGVAQWVDGTWEAHADRAGVPHVPHAANNSPATQDKVFVWAVKHAMYAWSYSC